MNQVLKKFILELSSSGNDMNKATKLFNEYVGDIAHSFGLIITKVLLISPDLNNHERIELVLYYNSENVDIDKFKVSIQTLFNQGELQVMAVPESGDWNEKLEEDFHYLSAILSYVFGRERASGYLEQLYYHDNLTGVLNMEGLYAYLGRVLASDTIDNFCINFMNIKNMKLINERYGNALGDAVMVDYAGKIKEFVGEKGCVARLGGDFFVCVIDKERQKSYLAFLEQMCVDVIMPNGIMAFVKVDCRLGYYNIRKGDGIEAVMNGCSIAYKASRDNRNADMVEFQEDMRYERIRMRQLEEAVPEALGNQEFVVYYQPKIELRDNMDYRLHGAEALVRWNKDGKLISPGEFIPILEKTGMIRDVDFYVLEHVCQDIKRWEQKGIEPVRISTNFSRWHLLNEDFPDRIIDTLRKYDVNPRYIEIEITESYDIANEENSMRFERMMEENGIRLSVDDFGSGFSSLRMLKDMAADVIKLDKSLIDEVGSQDEAPGIIVSHIIYMIKSLGKDIIAEGVERQEQADFLKKCNCTCIQGFLYGKPMPEQEFEERLVAGR